MMMTRNKRFIGLAVLPFFALGACTVAPPTHPTVVALPGPGKTFDQFQTDDANCQGYAAYKIQDAAQVANAAHNNANATAVAGTLIGAAAGAALGSLSGNVGAGAGIGAGAGLLGGASVASQNTQDAADSLQGRYDVAYAQCMVGHGEVLQQAAPPTVLVAPPAYGPPPGYYGPRPYPY